MIRSTPPGFRSLVATRNRSASLRRLLASLAASEPVPGGIEVVVVNDGSTDDTSPVVAASGARLVEGPHRGVAGALNAGWPLTVGERIIRLDDDVVLDPPALREMDLALDGADLVGATILPFGLGGAVAQFIQAEGLVDHRIIDGRARWLVGAACEVRREVLHEVGGWDAAFGRWNLVARAVDLRPSESWQQGTGSRSPRRRSSTTTTAARSGSWSASTTAMEPHR